jgi:hypothetical protein
MFTPTNITVNCAFSHLRFKIDRVNSGYHWMNPTMIVNTAPMDRM